MSYVGTVLANPFYSLADPSPPGESQCSTDVSTRLRIGAPSEPKIQHELAMRTVWRNAWKHHRQMRTYAWVFITTDVIAHTAQFLCT
jgi:hypothetical protein